MHTVPDFFQDESEEALRSQVEWQQRHLGLDDRFFAGLLREDRELFLAWWQGQAALSDRSEQTLRDWWGTVLHLLSFQNFDEDRVRDLLARTPHTSPETVASVFAPSWSVSLKEYLSSHGPEAIAEVDRWVESFRFGDPYARCREGIRCPSTHT
jgi:hypothetical protein